VDETGRPVGIGEIGDLQIFNANLTLGYLGDPVRTAALFDRGWLRTGDLAKWSEGGHVILSGRRDEQIKNRYGEIVQPAVVEALLCHRPDVAEAAVIGSGEGANMRITAFVVPSGTGGEDWLVDLQVCVRQALGPRQTPDRFVEQSALPRLSSGKIARLALHEKR
jgi:acyl-coenzyme A synthetase/AMP-(fatty) acid ligase